MTGAEASTGSPRRVFNRYHGDAPTGARYIGRGSPFGNPFRIGPDGGRAEVIAKYEAHLLASPDLLARVRTELAGVAMVCFCYPQACHGDVLARYSEAEVDDFDPGPYEDGF